MKKVIFLILSIFLSLLIVNAQSIHQADVIVYGGTSAAITTAVQLKKMQKSVIVVSPDIHLGGLSSGGLGNTDTGNKTVIGGLSKEFYHRVYQYYQISETWEWEGYSTRGMDVAQQTMWLFEPHIAEQVFEDFINEFQIQVYRNEWLDRSPSGIVLDNGEIKSFRTLSGNIFEGKIFIDATYEGDLMALANVDYHVGREANSVYGENWNGVQVGVLHHSHHFDADVDPFIIPGNPASGVLPKISTEDPGIKGEGDHRVQAYNFRMCLSNHPGNRMPFPRPENYDPFQYELLARIFQTGWREVFNKFDKIPNRKTDTNNHGPFSTDNIGMNYDYPEATYERRREIIQEHENYQKGLMYFLANDEKVPSEIRTSMAQWGLAADEFLDNGNWPHQIYVREARRMLGEFVMTENEILVKAPVQKPIGMGSYTIDSHNVQRYIKPDGFVQNEGDIGVGGTIPYQIDLGSILPKKEQCNNLLVPVCVSSSHIAFGSIRMEPVFMILGQSAGTVAGMALESDIKVHDVSYDELKVVLVNDGQVLSRPPTAQFAFISTGAYKIDFNGAASSDPDGTIVSWAWNFGDGSTGSGQTVSHTYANGNTYTVTLTVTDNSGTTATTTQNVTPTDTTPGGQVIKVGYTTVFTGVATGPTRRAEQITIPDAGQIKSLSIYHNGGSSNILMAVYADNAGKPGARLSITPVTAANTTQGWQEVALTNLVPVVAGQKVWLSWLTETNLALRHGIGSPGRIDSAKPWSGGMPLTFGTGTSTSAVYSLYANVIVQGGANQPPIASFTNTPFDNYGLSFNAASSSDPDGTIVSWNWNFGDGATGSGQTVSHTYANGNTYSVTLTVTDNNGATVTLSQNVTPVIMNAPPTAQFTFTPTGVYGIDFNGTGSSDDGTIVSWSWEFGDGTTGTGATVNHTYANGNTRTVILTLTDDDGATATVSQQVTPIDTTGGQTVQVGYTTVFTGVAVGQTRRAEQITIPNAGQIKSLSIYHNGGSSNILLAVYADNAGKPGTRLGVTPVTAVNTTQGWQEVVLTNLVPVVTGQKVWLSWLTQTNLVLRTGTGSPGRIDSGRPWSEGMPASFGTGSSSGSVYSLYANVIVLGGTNQPPNAQFTSTPSGTSYGINFNATTSSDPDGTIVSWAWDFGDGTTGGGQTVSHTYADGTTRTVTLTVTDNNGATGTLSQDVTPFDINGAPTAQFSFTPIGVYGIDFNATGSTDTDGTIVSWAWDFGDGTTGSDQTVSHTYANGNNYTVTLTVTDNFGAIGILSQDVTPVDINVAPTAQFSFTPIGVYGIDFNATGSTDTDGTMVSWDWDFGDGTTGGGQTVSHTYADGIIYTVTLTVTDNYGATGTLSQNVMPVDINVAPTAQFSFTPIGVYGIDLDATGSTDPDGTIVSWDWDFGDGTTGGGQTVSHTYADGSTYTVTLTVTDNYGATGTLSQNVTPVDINVAPTAQFSFTPIGVYGIDFDATGSTDTDGTIVSWAWDFGDGTTGSDQTVSHTYANGNNYTVTLTVTDNYGAIGILSQDVTPVDINVAPTAQFSFTPIGVYGIDFNATGSTDTDGTMVSWDWDFGDGTTGGGQSVSHTYADGSTYTVTLTVTDDDGAAATVSHQVTPIDTTGGQTVQVGYTTVFTGVATGATRRAEQITIPNAGQIKSLSIYHNGGSSNILLAVYADNAGKPGTRLGVTAITPVNNTQGWQEVLLESQVPVTAGQKVWLAWLTQTNLILRTGIGSPGRIDSKMTWSGGMPTNFGTGTSSSAVYSLYANVVIPWSNTREASLASSANKLNADELNHINVYPNPFNHHVNIDLNVVEENSLVQISLFDLNGKAMGILINDRFERGYHTIGLDKFDDGRMPKSGVYLLRVELNEQIHYKRLIRQ